MEYISEVNQFSPQATDPLPTAEVVRKMYQNEWGKEISDHLLFRKSGKKKLCSERNFKQRKIKRRITPKSKLSMDLIRREDILSLDDVQKTSGVRFNFRQIYISSSRVLVYLLMELVGSAQTFKKSSRFKNSSFVFFFFVIIILILIFFLSPESFLL